jgi:hypothetical protein
MAHRRHAIVPTIVAQFFTVILGLFVRLEHPRVGELFGLRWLPNWNTFACIAILALVAESIHQLVFLIRSRSVTDQSPSRVSRPWRLLEMRACFAHSLSASRSQGRARVAASLCFVVACFAVLLMVCEPFVGYRGSLTVIIQFHLMLPFLVVIGPLMRSRAWLGAAGAVLFYATSLSMIIKNAISRGGEYGFLYADNY